MNTLKNQLLFKVFNLAFLLIMFFTMSSCELEDSVDNFVQLSDLEVYVSGTLSDKPRSGLKVTIYDTEEDAKNEINPVTSSRNTDSDGFAYFQGMEPGYRYWVRVDTTLIHNINRSQVLITGFNEMSMTIL